MIDYFERRIAEVRLRLTELENGRLHTGERTEETTWRDTTEETIKHFRSDIAHYEQALQILRVRDAKAKQ